MGVSGAGLAREGAIISRQVGSRVLWLGLSLGLVGSGVPGAMAQPLEPLTLATGPGTGFYYKLGQLMMDTGELESSFNLVETRGSAENLDLLDQGAVSFALAQQDVVSDYFHAKNDSKVRVVGRVFHDYLHLLIRRPVQLESARDLQQLRVWPGPRESGTRHTAVKLLESVGLPLSALRYDPDRLRERPGTSCDSEGVERSSLQDLFCRKSLDAAMTVTIAGSPDVCKAMASSDFRLFPLDYKTLRLLTTEDAQSTFLRQVAIGNIPADTYDFQPRSVPTLAVPVLLLAREGESRESEAQVLRVVEAAWRKWQSERTEGGCRFHTEEAGGERGWPTGWTLGILGLVLFTACLGFWLVRRRSHLVLLAFWRRERVAVWGLVSLGLGVLAITVATYLIEHDINENFSNLTESFWSITIYLFSGLEDRTPYRPAGRIVAALGLILGPVFFAFLTGWLARFFIQWEKRMPQNLKDHFLILSWSERAHRVIRELHHPVIVEKGGVSVIVVLTDDDDLKLRDLKDAGSGTDKEFEDIYLSVGDPTSEQALLNANAQDARCILILANDRLGAQADERTLRSLVALRRIARDRSLTRMHVVLELVQDSNQPVVEEMARDFPGMVEQISGVQVRTCLLAQAALSPGVVELYRDLLQVSGDTNEIYTLPIPPDVAGTSFREYAARVIRESASVPLIPIGIQREVDGRLRMCCNPLQEGICATLQEGDRLVVLAYEPPPTDLLPDFGEGF